MATFTPRVGTQTELNAMGNIAGQFLWTNYKYNNTLSCKQDRTDNITKEVIDHLNEVAGTSYKASTSKTKTLIQARLKEGFSLDDFYRVIDKKCREWSNTEMAKYLRPETLFGTKFESYLNQPDAIAKPKDDYFSHGRLV